MANNTDVSVTAAYRVRSIEKNAAQVQVVALDVGGTGAESILTGSIPTSAGAYALRYDEGATYTYIASALPGSSDAAAVWQIKRLTNTDNTIIWADGDGNFDNVWNDRASLTYA